jgi:hypothetical protein
MIMVVAPAIVATLVAQVQTETPPVVSGAKPVIVERIKIHGTASKAISKETLWTATSWYSCPLVMPGKSHVVIP